MKLLCSEFASQIIRIAEGRATSLGKAQNREIAWSSFFKEVSDPVRTNERQSAFMKLTKEEQDKLKAMPGWLLGGPVANGRRQGSQIKARSLITLDADEITVRQFEAIENGTNPICKFEFVAHTTRKHTPENPRLRIFLLPTKNFPSEQYGAVSRIMSELIDVSMDAIDDVSFRAAQMMFKPSVSSDQEFKCWHNRGIRIGVTKVLSDFRLDWRDYKNLPYSKTRGQRRSTADKAENPLRKHGFVGAFCRAYGVEEAIAEFISDIYIPGDGNGEKPRYSYAEGTTSNGVVVEDGGLFIYSHHGSDPCSDRLCNAFDMVRIHLFISLDRNKKENSNPTDWPSFRAMEKRFADDEKVKAEMMTDKVDLDAMFDDISDTDDAVEARDEHSDVDDEIAELLAPSHQEGLPDLTKYKRPKKLKSNWHKTDLAIGRHGEIKATLTNLATIIRNDPRMYGAIAKNDLTGKISIRRPISSKMDIVPPLLVEDRENGDDWTDLHDHSIRAMLEAEAGPQKPGWGIRISDRDLNTAIVLVAQRNRFHPAVEYFEKLRWDGVSRIDLLWIDYMGTPDTAYHRETSRLFMLAVLCRVYNPGHKWDHAPILKGAQGIRKSTFIRSLFGRAWSGELTASMSSGKDSVEQMLGKLALELPELANMRRGEATEVKEFMTITKDRVRLAYDRRLSTFPRQCVFIGTTNADEYLKDSTGNRRFWPIDVLATTIATESVEADRDQLWAEAYAYWRKMAMTHNYKLIPLMLSTEAADEARHYQELAREEDMTDTLVAIIQEYLVTPLPLSLFLANGGEEIPKFDIAGGDPMVIPTVVTPLQIAIEALHEDRKTITMNKTRLAHVGIAMRRIDGWIRTGAKRRILGYGQGHTYELLGRSAVEAERRYRIVSPTRDLSQPYDGFDIL